MSPRFPVNKKSRGKWDIVVPKQLFVFLALEHRKFCKRAYGKWWPQQQRLHAWQAQRILADMGLDSGRKGGPGLLGLPSFSRDRRRPDRENTDSGILDYEI